MSGAVVKRPIFLALGVLLLGGAVSCRSPDSGGITVESYPDKTVRVGSGVFGDWFVVRDVATGTRNRLLTVTVALENLHDDCQFAYRYRWLDRDGLEIGSYIDVWEPRSTGKREKALLTGVAPTAQVEHYILDIRFPYKSTRWKD